MEALTWQQDGPHVSFEFRCLADQQNVVVVSLVQFPEKH
jgi:hypothetical protein